MSRYSGKYYKGAAKDVKAAKRAEAEARGQYKGGWLKPGLTLIENRGGQPEPVEQLFGINGYPLRDEDDE